MQNDVLKSVNAQVLQQVLRTLDRAFADMPSKKLGFPRFKNKYGMRFYVYPQMLKNYFKGNQIKLPQLGWVKLSLLWQGKLDETLALISPDLSI